MLIQLKMHKFMRRRRLYTEIRLTPEPGSLNILINGRFKMNRYLIILTWIAGLGLITACGSTNPPTQQLTETQMVIQQAEQVGAQDFAPLELRDAKIKLQQARDAVEAKDYDKAIRLAEHARVDAELAQAKALSGKSQKAAAELRESIRVLQEELGQKNINGNK